MNLKNKRFIRRLVIGAICLGVGNAAYATETSMAVYGGYRYGGKLNDDKNSTNLTVDESPSIAISLERERVSDEDGHQWQVLVSQQKATLIVDPESTASTLDAFPLKITYFQIGGVHYLNGVVGHGAYVTGALGATWLKPEQDDFSTKVSPSLSIGLGYQLPIGKHFGIRFEVRGYFTLLDGAELLCSNNCDMSIGGNNLLQGEALVGIAVRM